MQNSDFEIRLQTLAAMGGDTSKTYDSVYSIDLEILRLTEQGGGGGGMTYDQIKEALAASGVTEIIFNDGDSSITLDYDLVSQIGQGGGGDYICVNTIDELSGITDPKDGMIAYVGGHYVQEQAVALSVDYYNDGGWCRFIADYSGTTQQIGFTDQGKNMNVERGHFLRNNDEWFYGIQNSRNELPTNFIGENNNGVEGTLVSNTDGAEYSEHNECANTVYFYSLNGVLPTITLHPEEVGNVTFVSSSVTTETVSRYYSPKGAYKYYADVDEWLAFDVFIENYSKSELQTLCSNYVSYHKPLSVYFQKDWGGTAYRKGFAGSTYANESIYFTTPPDELNGEVKTFYIKYAVEDSEWKRTEDNEVKFASPNEVIERIAQKIFTTSQSNGGIEVGGLYSVGVNETVSGVTISTTLPTDATATTSQHIASIYNRNSGRGNWEQLSEDGWLFTNKGGISASTSPEWYVIDYSTTWDGNLNKNVTYIAAAKIEDNGDDTFTVTYFLGGNNWEDLGYDDRGQTDYYEWQPDGSRGYTWTVTQNQTLAVTPHLYTQVRFDHGDDTNARYIHKLI